MVNEFKLTVVHCMRVDLPLDKKTGKSRLGHRAAGPPGRRAAGPSRAVGRGPMGLRAAGPLGRRGPWAVGRWAPGLLLAKPVLIGISMARIFFSSITKVRRTRLTAI